MTAHSPDRASYSRLGPADARTPIVIAVPHAGRHYPAALIAAARLPREALETIEDRHADLLVADAVAAGAVAIVAGTARAFVDLNRDPREVDPSIVRRAPGDAGRWIDSEKVAGGLGVVPSRIAAGGAVWRHPLDPDEIVARIEAVHRPYHDAISVALDAARARHGVAVLIDCHSMPPLGGHAAARVVLGDRHGASAGPSYVRAASEAVHAHGLAVAWNRPYAGGFTLDRHGAPGRGRHAVQVEVDRTLYLDPTLRRPGHGLADTRALVARIAGAVAEVALADPVVASAPGATLLAAE